MKIIKANHLGYSEHRQLLHNIILRIHYNKSNNATVVCEYQ